MAHNTGVDVSASNPLPVAFSKRIDQTTTSKAVQPPVEASQDTTADKPVGVREQHEFQVVLQTHAEATNLEERAFIIRSMSALMKRVSALAYEALETADAERKVELQARSQEQIAAVAAAASLVSDKVSESLAAAAIETTDISTDKGAKSAIENFDLAQTMLATSQTEVSRAQRDLAPEPTERSAMSPETTSTRQQIENLGSQAVQAATAGIRDSAASLIG
jgi:hypothetical protein